MVNRHRLLYHTHKWAHMCVCVCVCWGWGATGTGSYTTNTHTSMDASEVELAIEKLNSHQSRGIDEIPAELIKAGCRTICSEIHKLIISIWNKVELSEEWKELIIVSIYSGDKTDCSNLSGISLLTTAYKILSNILLTTLTPYAKKITGDRQ